MHLKTYKLLALVLLLAIGMGCGGGSRSTGTGSGGDASLVGTWNLVSSSSGSSFPQHITFNANGTGAYSGGINSNFNWSQSGSTVTISTGSAQSAVINNLSSPVGNSFTLNSLGGTGTYNRA